MFNKTRLVSWKTLLLFILADYGLVAGLVVVLNMGWLDFISRASAGWIKPSLLLNLLALTLMVGGWLFWRLRLKPAEVGLRWAGLGPGLLYSGLLWLLVGLIGLAGNVVSGGQLTVNPLWETVGSGVIAGELLGQIFGNALYEEIVYRGFVLPQIAARLEAGSKWSPYLKVILALVLSQTFFALRHIPTRLFEGMLGWDLVFSLLFVLLIGVFLALVYWRTNNIFLAIGVHTLLNAPTALWANWIAPELLLVGLTLGLLAIWPLLHRNQPAKLPAQPVV